MVLSLVSGGAGYFGGLLARQLLSLGQEVRILDLNRTDLRGVEQIIIGDHNVAQVPLAKDDLAYGILLAIDAKAANRIYWLADERPYPIKEIVDTVREVLRDDFGVTVKPKTIQVPGIVSDLARLGDGMLQSLGFYNQELHVLSEMNLTIACTIDRAKHELGYRPPVDLREGMRRSIKWCLDSGIKI